MPFDSLAFAAYLPAIFVLFHATGEKRSRRLLLAASYFFYGYWDWRFLGLMLLSTVVDYLAARRLRDTPPTEIRPRRALLLASVATNLGILGLFKYFDFFVGTAHALLGPAVSLPVLELVLPVGISFYTFQSMAYTIDVYRGEFEASDDFLDFALYVSFFPQLVAGPIERASRLMPQLLKPSPVNAAALRSAGLLILLGLFKKVGIADAVAPTVDLIFSNPEKASAGRLLLGLYFFSIQIYCDFSGYSAIARGCARLLGVELMVNFRQPYFSISITEFWRHWHISLSGWLRDYLYRPLGGNRKGQWRTYRNLMLTMLLGGLWHGASWRFVVWGALHGLYLALERALGIGPRSPRRPSWPERLLRGFLVFHLVTFTWLFFRIPSLDHAITYLSRLFGSLPRMTSTDLGDLALFGGAALAVDLLQRFWGDDPLLKWTPTWIRGLAYGLVLIWILALGGVGRTIPFIYFQF